TTRFHGGSDEANVTRLANVADQSAKEMFPAWSVASGRDGYVFTSPVGQFRGNAFGIHDMHGNAWEWCLDSYRKDYEALPRDNPVHLEKSGDRVIRGGSWYYPPSHCRSAYRGPYEPAKRGGAVGFRVAAVTGD